MTISDDLRAVAKFGTPMLNGRTREEFLNDAADEIDRLLIMVKTRDQENANLRKTILGLRAQTRKFMDALWSWRLRGKARQGTTPQNTAPPTHIEGPQDMDQKQRTALQRQRAQEAIGMLKGVSELFGVEDNASADGEKQYAEWDAKVKEFEAWIFDTSPIA